MEKKKLTSQIDAFLAGTDKFLLSLSISKTNIIDVFIDGDTGVTIQDCIDLARAIEGEYDRDVEDFELRVSSVGVDKEFKLVRQLKKYLEKEIEFYLPDEKPFKAKLLSIEGDILRVEQTIGKGKKKEIITKEIDFESAEKIKPLVKFK
jgi:ribosome maturation factor RimP